VSVLTPPPPPPYQQGQAKGPQQVEGPLGENWNLGWQNAPEPPYGSPAAGGPLERQMSQVPGVSNSFLPPPPPQVPGGPVQTETPVPQMPKPLDADAIQRFLAPPPPNPGLPYLDQTKVTRPPYHYGF